MKVFTGVITSAKSLNTVSVVVEYKRAHPKYGKLMKQKTKLLAHNLLENVSEGDTVIIESCRPLSKNKFFRVREIVGQNSKNPPTKVVSSPLTTLRENETKEIDNGEKKITKKVVVARTTKAKKATKKK